MVGVGYQCRSSVFFSVSRRPRRWDPTSHGGGALKPEPWELPALPALPAPGADQQPAGGLSAIFVQALTNFRIKKLPNTERQFDHQKVRSSQCHPYQ